ncbi:hypothetical protein CROQUDRAFT_660672 [Cronartium quercuum f. sp. fusiforme G11]|uniref:Uncharacterized protein n=1 Tax=Cronartium quercuum f. sp. fusiforme G11 TaxID=708437 RepID=A0A9P6T964_9BASI|nr:hypothetical protein CROQUDRAFT_660672 [Cronartium quercuum f. sp. fusiforme G11]
MSSIPNSNAISPEIQAVISAALAAQAQVYKGMIARLERRFENMSIPATTPSKPSAARFESPPQATNARTRFCSQAGSEPAPSRLNIKSRTPASPATPKGSGSSSKPSTPSHKGPLTGPIKK